MANQITQEVCEKEIKNNKEMSEKSITKYIVMSIVGIVLFNIGLAMTIAGSVVFGETGNENLSVTLLIVGIIIMCGPGIALMIVGSSIWISLGVQIKVARNKINKYTTVLKQIKHENKK